MIAGRGLRVRECNESIIQYERLRARSAVKVARLSGICVKRLDEISREYSVFDNGARLVGDIAVIALSAKLKCRKKRHLVAGRMPVTRMLPELPLPWWCHESDKLEFELPEPERVMRCCEERSWVEWLRPLLGRDGELLRGRDDLAGELENSSPAVAATYVRVVSETLMSSIACSLGVNDPTRTSDVDDLISVRPGAVMER